MSSVQIKQYEKNHRQVITREETEASLADHQVVVNNHIKNVKKDYGIFFTPERIVDFMVSLIKPSTYSNNKDVGILEPACGLAQFLTGIKRKHPWLFKRAKLIGVEINPDIIHYVTTLNNGNHINIFKADYLLWESNPIFNLIIGNPPYGIPSLSSHYTIKTDPETKERYKSLYETWYGKYNVYGAFIEKSIKLLKSQGQLIFIIPATFMILDEFKKLRTFLSENGQTNIIYMGPDVFKPDANVASVILNFYKSDGAGLKLLEYRDNKIHLIKEDLRWKGDVVKFETNYTQTLERICSYKLENIYGIKISPRTPEIKHNHCVIKEKPQNMNDYLPILNGRNLKCNKISYDGLTGYWIKKRDINEMRRHSDKPHLVVGLGFRENGRVAAAVDERCYPWMGDIYHLLKRDDLFNSNFDMQNPEVQEYLNSDYLKKYVKDIYREITYHLSITQLKSLPLPSKKEWEKIKLNKC